MKRSKRYKESAATIDMAKDYSIDEAVKGLKEMPNVKFDETVEVSINLGVDPKKND